MEKSSYAVSTELYEDAFYSKLAGLYSERDYDSIEKLFIH